MTHLVRAAIPFLLFVLLACPYAPAVEVEVTALDGSAVRGRLVRLTPEIVLASASDEVLLAWSEVLVLRPLDVDACAATAAQGPPLRFELADGSTFGGRVDDATEQNFSIRLESGHVCRLDLSSLRAIHATSASAAARAKLAEVARDANRSEDVAVVERARKLIVLRGAVRHIGPQQVMFAWKQRELTLPWQRLAGLCLARPLPRRSSCAVRMQGGDVFAGRVIGGDERAITLRSGVFDELELPWSCIERVECHSQHLVFLSDLVPLRYEFTPFFQKQWDYARDKSLTGRPIRLAGRRYAKGLTMHSRSSLTCELDGKYRQFAALAGIVDEMAERGDVTLAVVGDGRVLWRATNVRGGEEPREVLVDVTGVRELSLHVDFGAGLDLSDHACWALARLIR